jgi:hypothetical protein
MAVKPGGMSVLKCSLGSSTIEARRQFAGFYCFFERWRRRRDLNPRDPFESNGFQDRRFQPLTHSSVVNCNVSGELAAMLRPRIEKGVSELLRLLTPFRYIPRAVLLQALAAFAA